MPKKWGSRTPMPLTKHECDWIAGREDELWRDEKSYRDSFDQCRNLTRHHAKSFYFSSIALPEKKKRAAYAVYAFCRYADDHIDKASDEGRDLEKAAEELHQVLEDLYAGRGDFVWARAFYLTVHLYDIPREYFFDLLKGVLSDRGAVQILSWEELHDYCYHVASVVGLMMSKIFELSDPEAREQAIEMGVAMQLTNILRDIKEDYHNDRIYLPRIELEQFAYSRDQMEQAVVNDEFIRLMKFQIARARGFYQKASPGILKLADDGSQLTVWIMATVYAGILDEIERVGYNIYQGRVHTSRLRKLFLLVKAWCLYRKSHRPHRSQS